MYKKFKTFFLLVIFSSLLFFIAINVIIEYYIPRNFRIIVDKEEEFLYKLPIEAKISGDVKGVLEINNKTVPDDQITISLYEPVQLIHHEKGSLNVDLLLFGFIPIENLEVEVIDAESICPVGNIVGITIKTDGILVLGTGEVIGSDGSKYSPSSGVIYTGDYIKKINGVPLESKEDLILLINQSKGNPIKIEIDRNGNTQTVEITPVQLSVSDDYKIGLWVRDDTQGIGTITYINKVDDSFAALGHGITDIDTNVLMKLICGNISETIIMDIKKGEDGNPGEITGMIVESNDSIGNVVQNTSNGVFGELTEYGVDYFKDYETLPLGFKYDIHMGEAKIISDISGELKEYDIRIDKINLNDNSNKGMIIEVTDEELIEQTNGIIQGMSGSPIIQDGKLIGAITHVFVQDSKKGYGTFIENMLLESE